MDQVEPRITVRDCIEVVAREHRMSSTQLLERTRRSAIAKPRQMAMYLACKMTRASLPDIGTRFGGFDHTTVMYARDKVAAKIEADPKIAAEIDRIAAAVANRAGVKEAFTPRMLRACS